MSAERITDIDELLAVHQSSKYISNALRAARARKGLTGQEVARHVDASPNTYYNFESAPIRNKFSSQFVVEICALLEIDAYDILWHMRRLHPDLEHELFANRALYDVIARSIQGVANTGTDH